MISAASVYWAHVRGWLPETHQVNVFECTTPATLQRWESQVEDPAFHRLVWVSNGSVIGVMACSSDMMFAEH